MIAFRSLLSAALLTLLGSGLVGCHNDQPPPARFPAPPPPVPGAPVVYYKFPFIGKWHVGRAHYGASQPDQAYALDLVPDGGVTDRQRNAGYPCYNQPVVADAPGVVVITVDGIPENVPGVKNVYDQHGNYVVIDHQNGEFTLLAHMIPGSIKVRPGMRVLTGTELGRCGNTGMSTNPHIHWQVMDNINAHEARGIPPRFARYLRNGSASVDRPENKDGVENQ